MSCRDVDKEDKEVLLRAARGGPESGAARGGLGKSDLPPPQNFTHHHPPAPPPPPRGKENDGNTAGSTSILPA